MKNYLKIGSVLLIALFCQIASCNAQNPFVANSGEYKEIEGDEFSRRVVYSKLKVEKKGFLKVINCDLYVMGEVYVSPNSRLLLINSKIYTYGSHNLSGKNVVKLSKKKIKIKK